jgi:anti-sigma factor RsiW
MRRWLFHRKRLTCRQLVNMLSDYVDGELPPTLQRRLEAHLEGCTPCTAFLQTFKQTQTLAQSLHDEDMPPELRQRLRSFLREQLPKNPPA